MGFLASHCSEDLIRPIGIAVYEVSPSGGMPGSMVSLIGVNFSSVAENNSVTVDGLEANVLNASDTMLMIQLPLQASFGMAEMIVTTAGLFPDTAQVIISENPLAEITDISSRMSDLGTIALVSGSNFNPDTSSYFILYEKLDGGFLVPQNEDGTTRNTLLKVYPDSLLIQVPESFREGRIRILTETVGKPDSTFYFLNTPVFRVR